jgi:hypothetical protein
MADNRIVAVGLLTRSELDRYGSALKNVFRVNDDDSFADLIQVIDRAERENWSADRRLEELDRWRRIDPA